MVCQRKRMHPPPTHTNTHTGTGNSRINIKHEVGQTGPLVGELRPLCFHKENKGGKS